MTIYNAQLVPDMTSNRSSFIILLQHFADRYYGSLGV